MSASEGDKVIRSKLAREMHSGVSQVNIGRWTANREHLERGGGQEIDQYYP
jgi:signal transduction histidine kinase